MRVSDARPRRPQSPNARARSAGHSDSEQSQSFPYAGTRLFPVRRRQVSEQLGELGPFLRVERCVHPVQEGLLAQPALSELVPELADRLVSLGIRGAHPAIVVRELGPGRLHIRKYRVAAPGTQHLLVARTTSWLRKPCRVSGSRADRRLPASIRWPTRPTG